jgi:hypothetical protein
MEWRNGSVPNWGKTVGPMRDAVPKQSGVQRGTPAHGNHAPAMAPSWTSAAAGTALALAAAVPLVYLKYQQSL